MPRLNRNRHVTHQGPSGANDAASPSTGRRSVKTENGPGSRCVEIRPHGLKDRPRPRDSRRAHPYRMDRPRPADSTRRTPTRTQTFNSTQRTRQATILDPPSTYVYKKTRRPTTRRRTQTEIANADQIGKRVILVYTRRTIPTHTGYRSNPTLLQRSDYSSGGHQKRICESATLYGENNVMVSTHFYSTRKCLSYFSPSFLISSA
jgi:hypothetical protein